jgi:hypothetical protein
MTSNKSCQAYSVLLLELARSEPTKDRRMVTRTNPTGLKPDMRGLPYTLRTR